METKINCSEMRMQLAIKQAELFFGVNMPKINAEIMERTGRLKEELCPETCDGENCSVQDNLRYAEL